MSKSNQPQDPEPAGDGVDDAVISRAFRLSLAVFALLALCGGGIALWIFRRPPPPPVVVTPLTLPKAREQSAIQIPQVPFTDITHAAGIRFVHANGAAGEKLLPETMGGGCAVFDFNNDGHQDILFVNSANWPGSETRGASVPTMALYQNDGRGNFADVTAEAGLAATFYGMGTAVGDFDNDGWVDVFFSAVGPNHLFRNNRGKFEEVTEATGVAGAPGEWSTSCAWFDYDNDNDLDLFVCNYVRWTRAIDLDLDCRLVGAGRAYCRPDAFEGTFPYLYRNDGEGKFTDISEPAGVQVRNPNTGVPVAKSLGVAPVDIDGDGWMDLVVANDTVQNFLFHNRKDGTFEEIGALAGIAFDNSGNARGAMGIDSGRFRNDGTLGIAIGNFANEMTALYCSQGAQNQTLQFSDDAVATGLGPPSRLLLKFGIFFFDADLDGRLDILAADGHLEEDIHKVQQSQQYAQPPQLYWNCGHDAATEFLPVPESACGKDFVKPMVGRGATYADFDGDGDLDVLITAVGSSPRLLRNDQKLGHHWLRLKLRGTLCNRDAIGARVEVTSGGKVQYRQVMPTRSYLSQVELPVTFGLGQDTAAETVTIRWPDGTVQELSKIPADQMLVIEQKTD